MEHKVHACSSLQYKICIVFVSAHPQSTVGSLLGVPRFPKTAVLVVAIREGTGSLGIVAMEDLEGDSQRLYAMLLRASDWEGVVDSL